MRRCDESRHSRCGAHSHTSRCVCTLKWRLSIKSAARDARTARRFGRASRDAFFLARGVRVMGQLESYFLTSAGFVWVAGGAGRRARHHLLTQTGASVTRISLSYDLCLVAAMCSSPLQRHFGAYGGGPEQMRHGEDDGPRCARRWRPRQRPPSPRRRGRRTTPFEK